MLTTRRRRVITLAVHRKLDLWTAAAAAFTFKTGALGERGRRPLACLSVKADGKCPLFLWYNGTGIFGYYDTHCRGLVKV